jgi:hypothetical protein
MSYHLKPLQKLQARKLGVIIKPSTKGLYKIDIFTKDGNYITSIGNRNYKDYITYVEEEGIDFANRRRDLYLKRHKKDIQNEFSRGWWAAAILWT